MTINKPLKIHKLPIYLLLLSAIGLTYLGFKLFITSLYSLQTDLFLNDWQRKQTAPSYQAWSTANQALLNAQATTPIDQASLKERQGKLYEWQSYIATHKTVNEAENESINEQQNTNSTLATQALQNALQAYEQQTHFTPSWPYAWINLLTVKIQLKQFDNQFNHALQMAEKTSNRNPGVELLLAKQGIIAWPNLTTPLKSKMLAKIASAASLSKANANNLKTLLNAQGLTPLVCIYTKTMKINTFSLCP